ncbi:hypothetical protein BD770DRAFT_384968 [Pilaira anomala]|nr:hypothetical protein BD770DRAFT_384968 [Pilaira anomala]
MDIDSFQQKKNNRNSMSAYVPVHRRNEEEDVKRNKFRSSIHNPPADLQMETSTSSKRSSMIHRRPPSTSNNRYSRNSFMGDDDLEYYDNDNTECPQEDWENILKQYDRYSMNDEDKRKSKRASRIMDSYHDSPVEVPVVDEPTVVLDCYDFPPAFKTHHLHDIFRCYEGVRGGYKIKWLSDTRALIIFDHPSTAKKAYIDNVTHALAKIRPYEGPTDFLKDSQNQKTNRPMSVDIKRQSLNAYGGRASNRNSMRAEEVALHF